MDEPHALVAARVPGHGLPRACYVDPGLYRLEMDAIWRKSWIFVGHSCEMRSPGDYVTLDLLGDPLALVRQDDGSITALHNVCRHRGSVVLTEEAGSTLRLRCPYHQWVYGRDGALISCSGAPEDFDKQTRGLGVLSCVEIGGLIFVCFDAHPPRVDEACGLLGDVLAPQGLFRAKVAARIDYTVRANWKLVWENNRECFHCDANHPQYVRANFDHYEPGDARHQDELDVALARQRAGLSRSNIADEPFESFGLAAFPDPSGYPWFSTSRTSLEAGYVSESMDGSLVAPVMGDYVDLDVGTLRLRAMPNFWCHASVDHAVTTRLIPTGPDTTLIRVSWLVDEHAEEGRDYERSRLLPFWQLTSEQDWTICERQFRGVSSSAFTPGPLALMQEANVEAFLSWYGRAIASA